MPKDWVLILMIQMFVQSKLPDLADCPEFDPKAHPHLLFLAHATIKIKSGKIDDFRDPANLRKIRAVKDYASSTEKHAAHVQGELDKFMERLKKQEDEKNAYLTSAGSTKESAWLKGFLKAVDEYVDVSSAPELTEEHYWKNGWGNTREEIIKNIGKFYVPINVKGQFRLKHDGPDGETEFLKKEDFLNIFEAHRTILTVETTLALAIRISQLARCAHNKRDHITWV